MTANRISYLLYWSLVGTTLFRTKCEAKVVVIGEKEAVFVQQGTTARLKCPGGFQSIIHNAIGLSLTGNETEALVENQSHSGRYWCESDVTAPATAASTAVTFVYLLENLTITDPEDLLLSSPHIQTWYIYCNQSVPEDLDVQAFSKLYIQLSLHDTNSSGTCHQTSVSLDPPVGTTFYNHSSQEGLISLVWSWRVEYAWLQPKCSLWHNGTDGPDELQTANYKANCVGNLSAISTLAEDLQGTDNSTSFEGLINFALLEEYMVSILLGSGISIILLSLLCVCYCKRKAKKKCPGKRISLGQSESRGRCPITGKELEGSTYDVPVEAPVPTRSIDRQSDSRPLPAVPLVLPPPTPDNKTGNQAKSPGATPYANQPWGTVSSQPYQSLQPRWGQGSQPQWGQETPAQWGQGSQPQWGQGTSSQWSQGSQPQWGGTANPATLPVQTTSWGHPGPPTPQPPVQPSPHPIPQSSPQPAPPPIPSYASSPPPQFPSSAPPPTGAIGYSPTPGQVASGFPQSVNPQPWQPTPGQQQGPPPGGYGRGF